MTSEPRLPEVHAGGSFAFLSTPAEHYNYAHIQAHRACMYHSPQEWRHTLNEFLFFASINRIKSFSSASMSDDDYAGMLSNVDMRPTNVGSALMTE